MVVFLQKMDTHNQSLIQEPATFKMEFFAAIVNGFQP